MKQPALEVGNIVKVEPRHWLRGNQTGTIMEIKRDRFLVEFSRKSTDGGLEGNKLWLLDTQLTRV